jgi:hypothetical protein
MNYNDGQETSKYEITQFSDLNAGSHVEIPTSPLASFGTADTTDDDLGNFFKRPIKIGSYSWDPSVTFFEQFNPWTSFLQNPRVINRITNYNLLRGSLCVKILVNGNGFHYGRLLASYLPFADDDQFHANRAFVPEDSIEASQRMHLYIDPTTSTGGSMRLPFVWPYNALSIPDENWQDMGVLTIRELTKLKNANDTGDVVTISVFAWMEDINLSVPTSAEPGALVPQSFGYVPQADEYGEDPASSKMLAAGEAAALVGAAMPQIAPLAEPAFLALAGAGVAAAALGFSRPNDLDPVVPFRPAYLGNMANANAPDSCVSLTLDQKAGLTPDTRSFGLNGEDELEVTSLASRESYLTSFPWPVSAAAETLLWNARVTPQLISRVTVGGVEEIHFTPMAYISYFARYWRGTIRYRFQIVGSAFHKGRLKIVWDPESFESNEYNVAYTHIVDISETRDFTIDVGWGSKAPYRLCNSAGENWGVTPLTGTFENFNGVISVFVVNDLAVPNTTIDNDISVNVMVCSPDLELAVPQSPAARLDTCCPFPEPTPQSFGYVPQAETDAVGQEQNAPVAESGDKVGNYNPAPHLEFIGDPIPSLRLLMKRYVIYGTHVLSNGNDNLSTGRISLPSRPQELGYPPYAHYDSSIPGAKCNFVELVPMAYIMRMFACWRGSVRYKCLMASHNDNGQHKNTSGQANVINDDPEPMVTSRQVINMDWSNDAKIAHAAAVNMTSMNRNGHATVIDRNPVLEFEVPYYLGKRFSLARYYSDPDVPRFIIQNYVQPSAKASFTFFTAAGEDFQVGLFVGTPILYPQTYPSPAP